ncbi:STAS domain-containing protein [Marichromatium bheemlicum]|uniref:STAS domain-containing protein n=1 Tax=Marichromatium bheemlicum TaxID=365339 RepID=A0ABX1IAF2_9GAMM|nr:STAS domain-containing protein [Marichromatium bheemlicum]NKN33836.1 STAS domain-containing protein [Marichromatium bheemlicum]
MSATRLSPDGPGRWRLDGVLDLTTVNRLAREGETLLRGATAIEIDLVGVSAANSAGLALLLEWLDLAGARGVALRYANLPDSLRRIAAFSNILELLPVSTTPAMAARSS